MPQTPHVEQHFTAGETIRDIVIGMSDGLTVPFALAAGLSGAVSSTSIIVTAGLAEIAAGSIAMGLGGYLAARSDADLIFSVDDGPGDQKAVGDSSYAHDGEYLAHTPLDPLGKPEIQQDGPHSEHGVGGDTDQEEQLKHEHDGVA